MRIGMRRLFRIGWLFEYTASAISSDKLRATPEELHPPFSLSLSLSLSLCLLFFLLPPEMEKCRK